MQRFAPRLEAVERTVRSGPEVFGRKSLIFAWIQNSGTGEHLGAGRHFSSKAIIIDPASILAESTVELGDASAPAGDHLSLMN